MSPGIEEKRNASIGKKSSRRKKSFGGAFSSEMAREGREREKVGNL